MAVLVTGTSGASGASGASGGKRALRSSLFASATAIFHGTPTGQEAVTLPDDLTSLGGNIYVAFQNGVGAQGEASKTGNLDSTVVEFDSKGKRVDQWDLVGKCDGLTADPATGKIIATVNEDGNSSLYLIQPHGAAAHYRYAKALPSHGGTDAIEIYQGMVLISGSAPGTTGGQAPPQASYPAVYIVSFHAASHTATFRALFGDEARAKVANTKGPKHGKSVHLALTDPDSVEAVPTYAQRFAGDFMLTSQGDDEQIFVSDAAAPHQSLSVLNLSNSVDDTVWPSGSTGAIYTTDSSQDAIFKITGGFARGSELSAVTPCNANSAPSTCPAPGFPANYLGQVNPDTGKITPVHLGGAAVQPHSMIFVP